MHKRWDIKEQGDADKIRHLSEALNIDKIIAKLLVQRGIYTYDHAKKFFRPELSHLYDPFLMKDMDRAVSRLEQAIKNKEKVLVYGDYDVDGTTSVSMIYSFLKERELQPGYYIPDRYSEGYGLSYKGIDHAAENGYSLVIALDCGIKAVDKIKYANEKNIDFIICDHHNPGETLPEAYAVLDPKRKDCDYPYKELSGCGVGFKMLQAYCIKNNIPFEEIGQYLDLVAVSIASDIVPITDENRALAFYGLKKLNTNPQTGLRSIINVAGIGRKEILVNDIAFMIGPRINAAGRIETGSEAVKLLISDDEETTDNIAEKINMYNTQRKDLDSSITKEALNYIEANDDLINRKTTVLYDPGWHKGVIGIVASKLIENYYRPTIVLTESNGMATGSARSVHDFNIYNAIEECSDLLENFGGHMYAAGVTMKVENIDAFSKRFEEVVSSTIKDDQLVPRIRIDSSLDLADITPKFYRILKQFEPFGQDNMPPVFMTENVRDTGTGKIVGKTGEHLKMDISQDQEPDHVFPAIAFNRADFFSSIQGRSPFNICYTVKENEYNGRVSLQIRVKDMRV